NLGAGVQRLPWASRVVWSVAKTAVGRRADVQLLEQRINHLRVLAASDEDHGLPPQLVAAGDPRLRQGLETELRVGEVRLPFASIADPAVAQLLAGLVTIMLVELLGLRSEEHTSELQS